MVKNENCGEVRVMLSRGKHKFTLQAVVVEELDRDILAGVPFMTDSNIVLDMPNNRIIVTGSSCIQNQSQSTYKVPLDVRRARCSLLGKP